MLQTSAVFQPSASRLPHPGLRGARAAQRLVLPRAEGGLIPPRTRKGLHDLRDTGAGPVLARTGGRALPALLAARGSCHRAAPRRGVSRRPRAAWPRRRQHRPGAALAARSSRGAPAPRAATPHTVPGPRRGAAWGSGRCERAPRLRRPGLAARPGGRAWRTGTRASLPRAPLPTAAGCARHTRDGGVPAGRGGAG